MFQPLALRRGACVLLAVLVLCSAGCGSDSNPTAPRHPAEGTWTGTLVDRVAGAGTMRMELHYVPATISISGTWSVALAQGGTLQGDVTGTASFQPMSGSFSCGPTRTAGGMSITVEAGRMHGTFLFFEGRCPPLDGGTIDVIRQ